MHKVDIQRLDHQLRDSGFISPILKTKFFISSVPKATASFIFSHRPELLLSGPVRTSILLNPVINSQSSPYLTYKQHLTQLIYYLPFQPSLLYFQGITIFCYFPTSGVIPSLSCFLDPLHTPTSKVQFPKTQSSDLYVHTS